LKSCFLSAALLLQLFWLPCKYILRSAVTRAIEYSEASFLGFCGREVSGRIAGLWFLRILLWTAADKLRNNMDAAEYQHVVLGLEQFEPCSFLWLDFQSFFNLFK
jgi:hypothetical protein